ncbi:GTP cyclohydrolase I FolE [Sphingobacterium shayense]|uniref:GTP cyclohydrolase I FolE n=1 Tax=Sphingobacterium shayense TaxID=626343 RepID=UPI001557F483|nr:GTP cyclohydrolase I FolE [Sphingobacterium shayense]NQD69524.1 GTP cyclohydrolase I FolE [Sphingobacterium shayense]
MADDFNNTLMDSVTDTPLHDGAFDLTEQEKIEKIAGLFGEIMSTLGLDLTDDSLRNTPLRVAKMYVNEAFSGLDIRNKPTISLFDNRYCYDEMLVEKNITLYSYCEHHFVPIIGKVHVAYIPHSAVIGLSKINRLVQYYAKRPQVQERLTVQIANELKDALGHEDVAVWIEADHLCVASRGIKDTNSSTITQSYSGAFKHRYVQQKFLTQINSR